MTALWVTIGVLVLCCWWLIRQQPKEYTQVEALDTLKKLYVPTLPRRKRESHLFRFQWRYAQDLERRRSQY